MNMPYQVAAAAVRRAGSRWKWLKFLRHTSVLGIITTALVLLFGVAMVKGWVFSETAAIIFFVVLGLLASILWTVVAIVAIVTGSKRDWLAGAVERGDHRLMDRLHTLLYLERDRGNVRQASFAVRIAQQTQQLFAEKAASPAFPPTRTLPLFLVFAGLLILTALFYNTFSPWDRMQAASASRAVAAAPAEKPLDLEMPATNNVEQQKSWGEVRITDPGGDLKVTKVDVVPLQIEAAANQALKTVSWASAINGFWDLHVHVPAGAVPKDGPSAGNAMISALTSIFTQRRVRHTVAMTGEITLRGAVLPVGGIKEKVLAAKRAGIETIILPDKNKKDLNEINPKALEGLKFHYVKRIDEVIKLVLEKRPVKDPKEKFSVTESDKKSGNSSGELPVTGTPAVA